MFFKNKDTCILSSDLAFFNAPAFTTKTLNQTNIALNFRDSATESCYKDVVEMLRKKQLLVSGISFCPNSDTNVLNTAGVSSIQTITAANFYEQSNKPYDIVVAMRYHGCVWAILQGIPFIGIAYDEKVADIATQTEQMMISCKELNKNSQSLGELISKVQNKYLEFQSKIIHHQALLIKMAEAHKKGLET